MTARTRAARAAAALVLAGATLIGTAGCTFLTPTATLIQYDPAEGAGITIGHVGVRNALLLPADDGETASLVMTVFNRSSSGEKVLFQYENSDGDKVDETVIVSGNSAISFGATPDAEQLILSTDAAQGSLLPVYVQYGDEPGKVLLVPVLDPNQPDYEDLKPADAEPSED